MQENKNLKENTVKHLIWLILTLFMIGCAPKPFIPMEVPVLKLKPTPSYVLDLSSIDNLKPPVIQPIFLNDAMQIVTKEEATNIMLSPQEYRKILTLLKMAKGYKDVAIKEGELINIKIKTINSLKELMMLEREKTMVYKELWVNSENAYRQEKYYHTQDNIIFKSGMYIISIGSMLLFGMSM